jgi:hypothetical protein
MDGTKISELNTLIGTKQDKGDYYKYGDDMNIMWRYVMTPMAAKKDPTTNPILLGRTELNAKNNKKIKTIWITDKNF